VAYLFFVKWDSQYLTRRILRILFSTWQRQSDINGSVRRATTFAIRAAAVVALAAAVISSSRAIAPHADGSAASEDDGSWVIDISAAEPAPSPPQCILCMKPVEFVMNFDDVTPPALPQGFIATNVQGPPPLWVTSNSGLPSPPADTPPNAAFIDDPAVISDKLLDLPGLTVFEALDPRLIFRQNFNLEASDQDPNLGFDGGVLEISVDQGQTYQDILDAGGTFVTGGYNRTISTDRGSPIAGRRAWSGNSGGFITTTVRLPDIIIQGVLRWRMASDNSGSGDGWRVDTIDISWCQGPPCTPTATATATPTVPPGVTPTPSDCPGGGCTPSPTPTATATVTRFTPTPRPRPTPLPRPEP
jgi:hypothetical protein